MMAKLPSIDVPILNLEVPAIAELASRDQWVCWKYAPAKNGDGKLTKVPVQPSGLGASTTNSRTWSTLNDAVQGAFRSGYGVGFVFHNGILGIDLDGARNVKTGRAEPDAAEILERFNSYTEISPSGTGYHIFAKGKLPGDKGRKGAGIEIYSRDRYFTMTGHMAPGSPETIEERQEAIDWFLATHFKPAAAKTHEATGTERGEFPHDRFDALMSLDDKFRQSWLHKRADLRDQSLSTYDMALCVRAALVGWTDEELAALIYHHRVIKWQDPSGKADRQDYIDRTISYARSAATQHSDGGEKVERAETVAVARSAADDVAKEGPDAALVELRTRLGIPVKRAIITGIDKALSYSMELDDGRAIEIGSITALLDQRRFRGVVAETTKEVLPLSKQPVWDGTVKVFLAAAEHVEPGDEDPRVAIAAALERYIDAKKACEWDSENADAVFLAERPMHSKDGALLISIMPFFQWLLTKGYPWKIDDVRRHMKACGWEPCKVGRRIDGKPKTQNRWSSVSAFPQRFRNEGS